MTTLQEVFKVLFKTRGGWFFLFLIFASVLDYTGEIRGFEAYVLGALAGIAIYNWDSVWQENTTQRLFKPYRTKAERRLRLD